MAQRVAIVLRTHDFEHSGLELKLSRATAFPQEIVRLADAHFDQLFSPKQRYRLTGVVLSHLCDDAPLQLGLFEPPLKVEALSRLYDSIDALDRKYGKHTVYLGASLPAMRRAPHAGARAEVPARKRELFKGETARKRLDLPMLGDVW